MDSLKKKVQVIINPVSGTSKKKNLPALISEILTPDRFDVTIKLTEYAGHGFEIAQQSAKDGIDYVIAVGGDGTVNEIGRALIHTESVLGIIPLGSGNGLGRDLKIALQARKALQIITEENVVAMDYGMANDRVFFCTCGVGFDAIVADCAKGQKKRGRLMYFKNIVESFFNTQPEEYEIVCAEGTIKDKAFVVTCANATQYGYDAHIAPHADVQDGMMNVMILKPLSLLDVPNASLRLFTKTLDGNKKVTELVTKEVTIRREKEGVMHIDGDPIQMGKEINVKIIPLGLKVLVSKKNSKVKPNGPEEFIESIVNSK